MKVSFEDATTLGRSFFPRTSLFWHSDRQATFGQPPPPQPYLSPIGRSDPIIVSGTWPLPTATADAVTSGLQAQRFDQTHLPSKY